MIDAIKTFFLEVDWEYLWKGWIGIFIVLESIALYMGDGRTLSANVWAWFNTGDGWSVERFLLLGFCIWLTIHFVWEKMSL